MKERVFHVFNKCKKSSQPSLCIVPVLIHYTNNPSRQSDCTLGYLRSAVCCEACACKSLF